MSDDRSSGRLPKWPFYFADAMLSAVAIYVLYQLGSIQGPWEMAAAGGCLLAAGWGAWFSIKPWLVEYHTVSKQAESTNLKSSLEQIKDLDSIAALIRNANSQWQGVQDASGRTVQAAQEISERMKAETADFMNFIQKAHDQERSNLRLEVEKLRRMEGEWIKTTVQILDHVFALNQAAARSGQEGLVAQLGQFQNACREVVRRMGLAPYIPVKFETFNAQAHQLPDANFTPPVDARVGEVLATGFTYQGQLLRRALVLLEQPEATPAAESVAAVEATPAMEAGPDLAAESVPMFKEEPVEVHADEGEGAEREFKETNEEVEETSEPEETRKETRPAHDDSQPQLPLV